MRSPPDHKLSLASPLSAYAERQERPQSQGHCRSGRDFLFGIVQRCAETFPGSPQTRRQGSEARFVGRASSSPDRQGPSWRGDRRVLRDLSKFAVTQVLKPVVAKDAVLCTDGNKACRAFASLEKIRHVRLIGAEGCRVVDKAYHIQNVNAYDSRLKGWM